MSAPVIPSFAPRPGAAPLARMVAAQAGTELRTMLRNGEQLLLILVIPVLLLVGFTQVAVVDVGPGARVDFLTPGVIALAVMSTAFTGQAIATGFERKYGVLKRLGATPLPRAGLLAAKVAAVFVVELGQVALLGGVALALGWRPHGSPLPVALLVLAGTAAFTAMGLALAGTLRAEATLAVANLVYLLLLGLGGVMFPLAKFPAGIRPALELLPTSALAGGLRAVLADGAAFPAGPLLVLAVWAVVAGTAAGRWFRWD